jgi:hypothetical protein
MPRQDTRSAGQDTVSSSRAAQDSLAQMVAMVIDASGDPALPGRVRSVQRAGDEVEARERSLFGREVSSGSHGASVVALSDSIALVEQMILRILTS